MSSILCCFLRTTLESDTGCFAEAVEELEAVCDAGDGASAEHRAQLGFALFQLERYSEAEADVVRLDRSRLLTWKAAAGCSQSKASEIAKRCLH